MDNSNYFDCVLEENDVEINLAPLKVDNKTNLVNIIKNTQHNDLNVLINFFADQNAVNPNNIKYSVASKRQVVAELVYRKQHNIDDLQNEVI